MLDVFSSSYDYIRFEKLSDDSEPVERISHHCYAIFLHEIVNDAGPPRCAGYPVVWRL